MTLLRSFWVRFAVFVFISSLCNIASADLIVRDTNFYAPVTDATGIVPEVSPGQAWYKIGDSVGLQLPTGLVNVGLAQTWSLTANIQGFNNGSVGNAVGLGFGTNQFGSAMYRNNSATFGNGSIYVDQGISTPFLVSQSLTANFRVDFKTNVLQQNGSYLHEFTYFHNGTQLGLPGVPFVNQRVSSSPITSIAVIVESSTFQSAPSGNGFSNLQLTVTTVPQPSTVATRATRYIGATGTSASTLLATDKVALLPGKASTFANYTNYSRGLNGIVVDVNGLPSGTTNAQMLASLQFASWDGIAAGGFVALPGTVVPTVAIAAGGGAGGSARVNITFPDNAVQNTWLRVTVLANANTGLAANDVFYFGNVVGELDFGNTVTRLRVNGQDAALILANQSPGANSAPVTNKFDLNRDGRVNGQDYAFLLANQQAAGIVAPITAP